MMNVAFFGTSDRSTPILESINAHFNLVLCVTKADTKVGRNQKIRETKVKKWAKKNNIPYLLIDSINKKEQKIIDTLKKHAVRLGIVADFGFIITKDIIITPPLGMINIHFSLLPKYRGASPVQFAILNGDKKTGVTYYLMDEKMDTGDIISQIEYKLEGNETSGELYKVLFNLAAEKLPQVIKGYQSGKCKPIPQDTTKATYTYSKTHPDSTYIFKKDTRINWQNSPLQIERQIRAYYPWPISWTTLKKLEKGMNLKIRSDKNKALKVKIHKAKIEKDKLKIQEIQVEGKKKMSWSDFKNGYLS